MQEKLTALGYRIVLATLISLIIIVGLAGVIRVKTKVLPLSEVSQGEVDKSRKASSHVNGFYYLVLLDDQGGITLRKMKLRVHDNLDGLTKLLETLLNWKASENVNEATFIPNNVSILNMNIDGDVLFIDFSEEFQFNTWGSQGYIGQLEQILRTIASVSMVRYLQIHINGERIDFLHEGVYIGRPIDLWEYKED
ncbi:GerMN domain-containing protein [Entomospira entomophila]|uniref:GerMN domain-containing protein n=1 Tax=Entomospira entomophila TaxID=2719988 RepID=A0A968GCW4_9SPIO|nr:GerMN domain-containing protein [Entomospira entomophilus]NIZ41126.1 hypothetical protein [Entomospira entomophilus]WDI35333.1 GerMN domain-containing protein [Entomospira entomophilus]